MAKAEEKSGTMQELSLVCQSDIVYFNPGDDGVLSCHLKPAISAASMEIMWWNKEDLVCHYKDGQMIESCEGRASLPLKDLHNGNVSLTLRGVRRSQKGLCICQVIHECQTLQDTVFLHISSEDYSLVVPKGIVYVDPGEDVILPVHLSPETSAVSMTVRWFRESELIYQYKNGQEIDNYEKRLSLSIQELERGNFSLTLRKFVPSDSGKFTCKVFHDGCLQTGIVHLQDIQICDEASLKHLHTVLKQVRDNILQEKVHLLTGTLALLQDTLNQDSALGRTARHSNSIDAIPPIMGDDGMHEPRTMAGERLKSVFGQNIIHITDAVRSMSTLNLDEHHHDQKTRRSRDGNTATQQESAANIQTRNREKTKTTELVIFPATARTHSQENPGATIQMDQERRQESESTQQERSSLQVQESKRKSQSVLFLPGDTTETAEKPGDRMQWTQRRQSTNTNCQIA